MPLEDEIIGHDRDGTMNESYCKWCYADGMYTYSNMDDLIDVAVKHMVTDEFPEEQAREYMKDLLPKLDYWKRYDELIWCFPRCDGAGGAYHEQFFVPAGSR